MRSKILLLLLIPIAAAQDVAPGDGAGCAFFGPQRERILEAGKYGRRPGRLTETTAQVMGRLQDVRSFVPGGSRTNSQQQLEEMGTIDRHIFGTLQTKGVTPAPRTDDYEFIRRVTLDLTGRIPLPDRVTQFVADTRANKRELLVDELLAKPEWVDKWTMFYGDLFKNNSVNTNIRRDGDGVAAFYKWIADALRTGKPYSTMATELIAARGSNSFEQGELNFLPGSFQPMVPLQDTYDQAAADVAKTFLGLGHLNCILCHNGRGHLDTLSIWGKSATRSQGWGMASFFSRTGMGRTSVNAGSFVPYYWSIATNPNIRNDYQLNTTTGNRPARSPIGNQATVSPTYLFTGARPGTGEDYRTVYAREIVADPLFSKAAVNYVWEHFFGLALVTPTDGFDPARLDPDNPPTDEGWALQPTNAALLRDLAADFVANKYDLKKLMRQLVTSEAYQLSSRYAGEWNPNWEPLYARHFVRRLWGEEIHDALVQSSGLLPSYDLSRDYPGFSRTESLAMRIPEPLRTPDRGGAVSRFLDSFLRGNRDDEERRPDGSISQALALMNDPLLLARIRGTGNANLLLQKNLSKPDEELIQTLFLTVLSRPPSDSERAAALAQLRGGARTAQAEDLLWSLYNKVDFIFSY
jgi:hypothetical protein